MPPSGFFCQCFSTFNITAQYSSLANGIWLASLSGWLRQNKCARAPERWTMWKLILLLWLVPSVLAIVLVWRVSSGMSVLNRDERHRFFDERRPKEMTPWLLIKLAGLALAFFMIGLLEGVILLNMPFVWTALAVPLTGTGAILLSARWVRSNSQFPRIFRRLVARTTQSLRQ